MKDGRRLDVYLFEEGLAVSRERARAYIMEGRVDADGVKRDKPSYVVRDGSTVTVRRDECEFVSRGGLKLKKALAVFGANVAGKTGIDVGASTGGFTDCLLKNGAKKVYAVDVGYGQLDYSLREDDRVVVMERQNARFLTREMFAHTIDFAVMDVSFISIKLLLPPLKDIVAPGGFIISLIKPQFEAGRDKVGKKGVVRDRGVHEAVVADMVAFAKDIGLTPVGLDFSPITGPNGNIEFLLYMRPGEKTQKALDTAAVVADAYTALHKD